MSRKGVTTKRVKTVQTALSRISAQPRSPAGRGTMFRARPKLSVRLKSRPKSNHRPITHHDPGNKPAVGQATTSRHAAHDHAREPGKPRGRATLTYHGRCSVRAGELRPRPAERFHRPNSSVRPPGRPNPATTVPTRPRPDVRPIVPTDRPNAAVDPKPVLKPISYFQGPA
ncbi:unnamed protein product [Microthlaspi erraticum]|uniref:Uncharacterized protein n=1 Tax=Microthlaspi erraticum TaxID=1685480 RepID=A0A6D2KJV5_9BRAS|nr:unnamed protein product [Microthlaspi erraticum]